MKKFIITEQEREGLLEYLATRPYREVVVGIQVLAKLPEHKEGPKK